MDNELKAMQVAMGTQESQAEVVVSTPEITPEVPVSAEMAVEKPAEVTPEQPLAEITPEQPTPSLTSEPYNYWQDLDSKTEGLVKDAESLSEIIKRSKDYDTLAEQQKSLFKPANDYIAKLNEMTLAGANQDQIKAFVTLNGYGDLTALSPLDIKVTKMVLTEGYSEATARKLVNREFNLDQFDEAIPEHKENADIMREQLAISAKKDLQTLQEYKKELSTVDNPEKAQAEQQNLQRIADASNYNKTVEREAPNIAKHFPTKLDYEFKVGDAAVPYEDSFDKEFLDKELPNYLKEYYKDSMDPINAETLPQAYSFALGEYLKQNDHKRLEKAFQKGDSAGYERAVQKYENRSGLPKAQENQVITTTEPGLSEFMKKMVGQ